MKVQSALLTAISLELDRAYGEINMYEGNISISDSNFTTNKAYYFGGVMETKF